MSISLCMICKDEENFIESALKSALDFVDEIIVVDTGSQDNTIDIAQKYTSKIIISPWEKDFSLHKNQAISEAKCDWILFLDCDEVIQNKNNYDLKKVLNNSSSNVKGYNLNIVNIISNIETASFLSLRLFKNFEDFHFEGKIHEQIIPSIINKYGYDYISTLPIHIYHYGYDEAIIKNRNKVERNLEILYSIDNKNGYTYAMIGDEFLKSNNLDQAVFFYEKSLFTNNNINEDYSFMLIINYLSSLINLKNYNKSLNFIREVHNKIPYFRDLLFLEFWILYNTNCFSEALTKLDQYINFSATTSDILDIKRYDNIYNLDNLRLTTISMMYSQ